MDNSAFPRARVFWGDRAQSPCQPSRAASVLYGAGKGSAVTALLSCFPPLLNQHLTVICWHFRNSEGPLKEQSEHCVSELLGTFQDWLWTEHAEHLTCRTSSLCRDSALGRRVEGNAGVSFPRSWWEFQSAVSSPDGKSRPSGARGSWSMHAYELPLDMQKELELRCRVIQWKQWDRINNY